jgi:hypothetical protein
MAFRIIQDGDLTYGNEGESGFACHPAATGAAEPRDAAYYTDNVQ